MAVFCMSRRNFYISIVKPTRCIIFEFIEYRSSCFRRSFRPSSGVLGCTHSIRYMSYRLVDCLPARPLVGFTIEIYHDARSHERQSRRKLWQCLVFYKEAIMVVFCMCINNQSNIKECVKLIYLYVTYLHSMNIYPVCSILHAFWTQ